MAHEETGRVAVTGAEQGVRAAVPIHQLTQDYEDYLHDESRSRGSADSISFPVDEDDVRAVLRTLDPTGVPVTVQGARTGLAAGAVPQGGHILNLSRMNHVLGLRRDAQGRFVVRCQPGVVLSELRKYLHAKAFPAVDVARWDEASRAALEALQTAPEQMFPTDPTETSACLGGMAACNASGARSYRYGPMRPHVVSLRLALADGDMLALRRGEVVACGRHLELATELGRRISLDLPGYTMPRAKNASGYYVHEGMDAIDLVIGSDGTLGVITELEVALMPVPPVMWGVSCFFADERQALDATCGLRDGVASAAAIEYFDPASLDILRVQRERSTAFSALPLLADDARCCVYVELHCGDEREALDALDRVGEVLRDAGGSEAATWVARTELDRESLQLFRHAVPESVNMLIDERRRTDPAITKLGSDMSVPDERLHDVMRLYRETLAEAGLESAAWGHIGDNHLHVNVLPRDMDDYRRGKELFGAWAREVVAMGGAVSAEHGVGKLKRDFLKTMYGEQGLRDMARVKLAFDPAGQLGRGNLFDESLLEGGA